MCLGRLKPMAAEKCQPSVKVDHYLSILRSPHTIPSHPHLTAGETEAGGRRMPSLGYLGSLPGQGWLSPPVMDSPASLSLSSPLAELRTIRGRCEGGCQSCRVGISGAPRVSGTEESTPLSTSGSASCFVLRFQTSWTPSASGEIWRLSIVTCT